MMRIQCLLLQFDLKIMWIYLNYIFVPFSHHLAMRKRWKCQSQSRWIRPSCDWHSNSIWWENDEMPLVTKHNEGIFHLKSTKKKKSYHFGRLSSLSAKIFHIEDIQTETQIPQCLLARMLLSESDIFYQRAQVFSL